MTRLAIPQIGTESTFRPISLSRYYDLEKSPTPIDKTEDTKDLTQIVPSRNREGRRLTPEHQRVLRHLTLNDLGAAITMIYDHFGIEASEGRTEELDPIENTRMLFNASRTDNPVEGYGGDLIRLEVVDRTIYGGDARIGALFHAQSVPGDTPHTISMQPGRVNEAPIPRTVLEDTTRHFDMATEGNKTISDALLHFDGIYDTEAHPNQAYLGVVALSAAAAIGVANRMQLRL